MWRNYIQPTTLEDALRLLRQHAGKARLVAGGTDVVVELSRGIKPTETLIEISRLPDLKYVRHEDGWVRIGALATHNDVLAWGEAREKALPLAQACIEIGAPQIRTRATVVGNLVTASPANDTISALMALEAEMVLVNADGERVVSLDEFYQGVRRTVLARDEMVREVRFPALRQGQRGLWLRLGLRRAQAISVIHMAFVLTFDDQEQVNEAHITLGALAPVIVHARRAEAFLSGKKLDATTCEEAGRLACADVTPISDLRGSADYRLATLAALITQGLMRISEGKEAEGFPRTPVLLDTGAQARPVPEFTGIIEATINGERRTLANAQNKTLLNALREDAGLTGTKEGCAEGECGACTIWINGQAAMSCLVPAPQAHHAEITTIEGLASEDSLHPLQESFIKHAAVQCGFCIPGFIMAGAKLLQEKQYPEMEDVQVAVSGNICRCTGYKKIFDALLDVKRD